MTKEQIRAYQKELRAKLTGEERQDYNRAIRIKLQGTDAYRSCDRLFAFISFQSEIDTHEIIRQAFQDGKKIFVPRVEGQHMEFYEIFALKDLIISRFGVPEPEGDQDRRFIVEKKEPEVRGKNLMLMPGLAFDRLGQRIGYGAGYYDKYLAGNAAECFHKIAIAYPFQIMTELPAEETDIRADEIITPVEIIQVR